MKKLILSITCITTVVLSYGQTPSLQWEKSVNGQYSGYDNTQTSWQDPGGNFLITGTTSNDAFILKIDNNGNELLRLTYDGPQSGVDNGYAIKSDASGNIYLAGLTDYNSLKAPFVVKYSSSGVKLWEYIQSNISVTGTVTAIALDNYSNPTSVYFTGSKNDSSAITRLNTSNGASVWEKTLWPHGKMNDIDIDNNGHPLVCGYQAFTGVNADFYAAVLDIPTGYPLRGFWQDGSATDSVTNPSGHFDMAAKIKAGPAGTFVVFGTLYNTPTAATIYMAKFGSTGNTPTWVYTYDSPTHTEGNGVRLLTDASFSNFYFLAGAMSTTGSYYGYTIAGKVNNTGTAAWVKEFNVSAQSLVAHDMALDANGNAHIISDAGYPGDIYYKKLSSSTGNPSSTLQYDNQRGGGNAYDYSSNIFLDNTGHPYITGSSNALTYTDNDVLLVSLNTNATLNWDITFDFFVSSQNFAFNVQTLFNGYNADQVITCGEVINNITSLDVSITSYSESGAINWQNTFDDNNGGDHVVGFEKSYSGNLFLCSYNYANSTTSITEFYNNGTTNFSNKPGWSFQPSCFKIDSAENSFVASGIFGASDFNLGIYLRTGVVLTNTPATLANTGATPASITTDNASVYVAGTIDNVSVPTIGRHPYIEKFNLAGALIWSATITGFDSTSNLSGPSKIVYDRASGAVYVVGTALSAGSAVTQSFIARINANGTIAWVRKENAANTRYEYLNDIMISHGKIYVTGYAHNVSTPTDNFALTEMWDLNGNKQWEYVFDKATTDEEGASVVVDTTGNIFVGGKTNGIPSVIGNSDMLLLKLNAAGNLIWKKEYNSNGDDYCANIALSNSNLANPRIYMSGNIQSTGYNYDIATLKYCDLPVAHVTHPASTNICANTSITLGASGGALSNAVVWAPGGQISPSISVNTTGSYYFTSSDPDGCSENSDTVNVNLKSPPAAIQICMVTVDSLSTYNIIYWDKTTVTPDVVGFKMYREDLTNIYSYIGSVSIDSISEFHDYGANPNVTTKRYKISAVDSCGNESAQSNYHNTIYIVDVGSGQYIWNPLYTIENTVNPVSSYVLMRDDNSTGNFQQIASTAGNQNTLTDPSYASYPNGSWRVDALGFNCNPTLRLTSGNNSTLVAKIKSHSNQTNNRVAAGINQISGNTSQLTVYPNPSTGNITVSNTQKIDELKVIDVLGNIVYEIKPADQKASLHIETSGVYFITVISGKETTIKKVVISN